jgi:hypothetical protein
VDAAVDLVERHLDTFTETGWLCGGRVSSRELSRFLNVSSTAMALLAFDIALSIGDADR